MCVYQTSLHECDQKCLGALPGAYELRTCARAQTQSSVRRVLPDQGWGDGSGPLGDLDTQTGGQHWLLISLLISCMVVSLNIFSRGLGSLHPADKHLHTLLLKTTSVLVPQRQQVSPGPHFTMMTQTHRFTGWNNTSLAVTSHKELAHHSVGSDAGNTPLVSNVVWLVVLHLSWPTMPTRLIKSTQVYCQQQVSHRASTFPRFKVNSSSQAARVFPSSAEAD